VESILAFDGKIVQVWCKVCTLIEIKEIFLIPKLDSHWKHANPCKVLIVRPKVKVGEHYFLKTNAHVAKGLKIILITLIFTCSIMVAHDKIHNNVKLIYKVKCFDNPMKHWFDGFGWEMANCMCEQVLSRIQIVTWLGQTLFL
jgi:hypothetical protein